MKQFIPFAMTVLAIAAACTANNEGGTTGTVKGSVKDTAGDALVGVRITVVPPVGDSAILHTGSDGSWEVENVGIGTGTVTFDSLPSDCPHVAPQNYFLLSPGTTASVALSVACTARH